MRHALILALTLAASPALAAEVNVYTTRQPELIQPIFDAFTAETGTKVNVLYAEKGLIERLQAEGDRSPADLYITADTASVTAATEAGLTQPHGSAAVDAAVPADLRDPNGHWFALTKRARIVYAAKDRVPAGAITTWEDLADPKWKGKICTRPGAHSYNVALIAAYIGHHGEAAAKTWLEGVKANLARAPQGNDRAQVKSVWAGECDIAIGNTYYMGKMLDDPEQQAWANAVTPTFPVFEGAGTHINISGAALTKSAPNKATALALVEYMLSPAAQTLYAQVNYEYPVRTDVAPSPVVAGWGGFTPDTLELAKLGELRAAALRLVDETAFDK